MKISPLKAFTLIELIVVITIMGIISLGVYLPYSHHQKKTIIKQATKEVSQSLSEARNLAIHGRSTGSGNLHVGLFFEDTHTLLYHGYPLSATGSLNNAELLKTKKLPRGATFTGSLIGIEYFFEAISGELIKREIQSNGNFLAGDIEEIEIFELSYMGASTQSLQESFDYYTKSHITEF
ncbi:type II secretion system GspH family protein [Candidatus Gracilibacteria bacterium]|nr:type II secretion system GspH family protein [Candidatus Gracilibacteria bacterium]